MSWREPHGSGSAGVGRKGARDGVSRISPRTRPRFGLASGRRGHSGSRGRSPAGSAGSRAGGGGGRTGPEGSARTCSRASIPQPERRGGRTHPLPAAARKALPASSGQAHCTWRQNTRPGERRPGPRPERASTGRSSTERTRAVSPYPTRSRRARMGARRGKRPADATNELHGAARQAAIRARPSCMNTPMPRTHASLIHIFIASRVAFSI